MTLKEVLDAVAPLDEDARARWLIDLGWAMTVSARAGYPLAKQADSIPHLVAFNELQHQLFNYLRHLPTGNEWTIEDFLNGLCQKAKESAVEGDFGWAVKWSVERITA
jgi:hypothetical protein